MKKTTSQNIWPRINSLIKTARSAVSKNRVSAVSFLRRHSRNFENATLVARWREHLQVFGAIFLVAQIPPKEVFQYTRIHSLLLNGIGTASSHAL